MSEPFVGEIRAFGFGFAPRGWAQCMGQLLPIAQNTALFSLLGTSYGGDGRSTFGLPDLRGRVAVGLGQGPGLSHAVQRGESGGVETVTLLPAELPAHTHRLGARAAASQTDNPTNAIFANGAYVQGSKFGTVQQYGLGNDVTMAPAMLAATGGGQAHTNVMPSQSQNFCIALTGIFPQRA